MCWIEFYSLAEVSRGFERTIWVLLAAAALVTALYLLGLLARRVVLRTAERQKHIPTAMKEKQSGR